MLFLKTFHYKNDKKCKSISIFFLKNNDNRSGYYKIITFNHIPSEKSSKRANSTNHPIWTPICRNKSAITPKWFNSLETNSSGMSNNLVRQSRPLLLIIMQSSPHFNFEICITYWVWYTQLLITQILRNLKDLLEYGGVFEKKMSLFFEMKMCLFFEIYFDYILVWMIKSDLNFKTFRFCRIFAK